MIKKFKKFKNFFLQNLQKEQNILYIVKVLLNFDQKY